MSCFIFYSQVGQKKQSCLQPVCMLTHYPLAATSQVATRLGTSWGTYLTNLDVNSSQQPHKDLPKANKSFPTLTSLFLLRLLCTILGTFCCFALFSHLSFPSASLKIEWIFLYGKFLEDYLPKYGCVEWHIFVNIWNYRIWYWTRDWFLTHWWRCTCKLTMIPVPNAPLGPPPTRLCLLFLALLPHSQ